MITVQAFTFNPLAENTYLLYNETGACCIIDPGAYFPEEEQALTAFINENKLQPVLLLNTHCHFDHIFGNSFIHRTYGLELHLHRNELPILERGPQAAQMWGFPPFENFSGPMHFLDEGSIVKLGGEELEVLFTPGHSPGSISFYSRSHKFIVGGDVLFQGSIGRDDLPGGDGVVLRETIKTKFYTLPADVIVYPGHGGSTTIGDEAKGNAFVRME